MIYASRFLRINSVIMTGPDVLLIQERLKQIALYTAKLDGKYGSETEQAVKVFQQSRHLNADGIVGPDTWRELNLNSPGPGPYIRIGNKQSQSPLIDVNVDKRILQFYNNDKVKKYKIAVGKPSTPTPTGQWKIVQKLLNPGGPFGSRWMRLGIPWGGYGIHGTNNPSSIDSAASHGCIRMYNADVVELYDMLPLGTPVNISNSSYTGRTLMLGSRGEDVKQLQYKLIDLNYYQGKADGEYGYLTRNAVIKFQTDNELNPDGIVGNKTYKAIQLAHDSLKEDSQP